VPADVPAAAPSRHGVVPTPRDLAGITERWTLDLVRRGIERLEKPAHVREVAALIQLLGPNPEIRDSDATRARARHAALLQNRRELAERVIAWCPSVERLGRWLARVARWYGVKNLAAYLRRAAQRGDPGTLLGSHARNRVGRAAENWRDFSPDAERALVGEHAAEVAHLIAGGAVALQEVDAVRRADLRAQLQRMFAAGRRAAARSVLLQLVGNGRSDEELADAIGCAIPIDEARKLLAA
jgi:hypothetical protein